MPRRITADFELREAARLLALMLPRIHVLNEAEDITKLEVYLPTPLFDRLCLWGAATAELEPDEPLEDDGSEDDDLA